MVCTLDGSAEKSGEIRSYLILHGWQNHHPDGHWQRWLAGELRSLAERPMVAYPQLPNADLPDPDQWAVAILSQLRRLRGRRIVICHSLGCSAWQYLAVRGYRLPAVDRLVFVAPPGPAFLLGQPEIAGFVTEDRHGMAVANSCRTRVRLVHSDGDRHCPEGFDVAYGERYDFDAVAGAGHFDIGAGFGVWQQMLRWCQDQSVRFAADPARQPLVPVADLAVT